MTTVASLLQRSTELQSASDSALLDAELLLCHCLNVDRTWLKTWPDHMLQDAQIAEFERLFSRRLQGEPVAFITGTQGFWTLDLCVSPHTLIPRPETELVVENVLELALPEESQVLDLGTGTGAIALALAAERPEWQIVAVDLQAEAVELAEHNREINHLPNVTVLQSDWFSALAAAQSERKFDLIVSNPPYVDADDLASMPAEYHHEPVMALAAGADGLDIARKILAQSADYLTEQGILVLEVGNSDLALEKAFPSVPFLWLEFARGGHGVCVFTRQELLEHFS